MCEEERCMIPCRIKSYIIMTSFSKLREIYLNRKKTNIAAEYHESLEMAHRIKTKLLVPTITEFIKALDAMRYYKHIAEIECTLLSTSRYSGVRSVLVLLREQIYEDAQKVLKQLTQIKGVYMDVYGYRRQYLEQKLTEIVKQSKVMVQNSLSTSTPCHGPLNFGLSNALMEATKTLTDIGEEPEKMFVSNLRNYLKNSNQTTSVEGLLSPAYGNLIPENLEDKNGGGSCPRKTLSYQLRKRLTMRDGQNCMSESEYVEFVRLIAQLDRCRKTFPDKLDQVNRAKEFMDKMSSSKTGMHFDLQFNFEFAFRNVTISIDQYENLASLFFTAEKSKDALSKKLTRQNIQNTVNDFEQFQQSVDHELRGKLMDYAHKLHQLSLDLYTTLLDAMAGLRPHYKKENLDLEKMARDLLVWRKPEFSTETDQLIEQRFQDSKSMWSPNRNFESFVKVGMLKPLPKLLLQFQNRKLFLDIDWIGMTR